ncbi:inositol polyphosphate 5-phosphatase OCRL-1-like isoform X1 [Varroa destructor]|uniref:phosphoinositide 5-phosphatase n=1 Tax=Varroa destructor TaxID=109461 RepID=A0A7M7JS55_VARDE|nr:inositol polyphosphate 5-phosphatase OCRL-1-like isoform X1 [Varroa destructor]XP_022656391.1 inositol polyphosphate 5-phosphatase OCRL-1-like isoform X1 [Varroa destructor]
MDVRYGNALRRLIAPDHRVVGCIRCTLSRGRKSVPRVCVLVEHLKEHCLLVCTEEAGGPQVTSPAIVASSCGSNTQINPAAAVLSSDSRMPINSDFKFDVEPIIGSGPTGRTITATITYKKKRLIFEVDYSDIASQFVRMVSKAVENASYRTFPSSDYHWVEVYKNSSKFFLATNPDDPDDDSVIEEGQRMASRECMVKNLMQEREEEFTVLNQLRIFSATWNVNGQSPGPESLSGWLSSSSPMEPPDVYAIGFQEVDLSKEAFVFADSPREKEWLNAVKAGLHPRGNYREVKTVRLVGMMLSVFVDEKHLEYVTNVDSSYVGTGVLGMMGNKGGVAIRMDLHSTSVCFVNCHLAAHAEERDRRNQDFNDIRNKIMFNSLRPNRTIREHDHIYWIGDMNYRLQDTNREMVELVCASGNFAPLWERDQLRDQQHKGFIFVGFEEGALNFRPTYKYDVGTSRWDTSEKARVPAYCDRILWRGSAIQLLTYRSHDEYTISDHKPVSALFSSGIRVVDAANRKEVYQEVMKQLDKEENDFLPQVAVDQHYLHFSDVHFYERVSRSFKVTNTGPVIVKFLFKEQPKSKRYCRPWLKADPYNGTLKKGESCDITLEVLVDTTCAAALNSGIERTSDVLVLHLQEGKDIFISVDIDYRHSCFGCSLEALVRHTTPIGLMAKEALFALEKDPERNAELGIPFEIPTELWVLIDGLNRKGLEVEGLFVKCGSSTDIQSVREALDNKMPDGNFEASVFSVAECLLLFLNSLREPVIPFCFFKKCLDSASTYTQAKAVLRELPKVHRDTFRYLVVFLQELLRSSQFNKLDINLTSTIFSSVMIRPPQESQMSPAIERTRCTFLYHFLVNPCEI